MSMDALITFVDGKDPLWRKDYEDFAGEPIMAKRFRDWGTLRYLLRGIQVHMPFIERVFLLVARESQVPDWADPAQLRVVLHREIIPQEYLPTFNSTMIEMFLHRTPGLGERFIYFNDDMFPVGDLAEEVFYPGGKPAMNFRKCLFRAGMFRKQARNSDILARKALGLRPGVIFVQPQHTCAPMLRSESETLFKRVEPEILQSLSRTRAPYNCNQYLFTDYLYYQGKALCRRLPNKHFSLAATSGDRVAAFLRKPSQKLVCINDVHLSEEKFRRYKGLILGAFKDKFPEKSRFER
jgi:hypothetical protein